MKPLIIAETTSSPQVIFDPGEGRFLIAGESRPEFAPGFYGTISDWLKGYIAALRKNAHHYNLKLEMEYIYFNTSSAKCILNLMRMLQDAAGDNVNVSICWYYDFRDDEMKTSGEEFARLVSIPFDIAGK